MNFLVALYRKLFPSWVEYLQRELSGCDAVLDLGCGRSSPIQHCKVDFSVGVELFEPYLQESKDKGIHNEYINSDVREIEFEAKSFDAVVCLELLEHLTKEEGCELIEKMEGWARKKIVVTTPNGYLQQDSYDENLLQEHKSGWSIEELRQLGFKVYGMKGWRQLKGHRGKIKYRPLVVWEKISHLSQAITYYFPKLAFQLFAVKELGDRER